MDSAGTVGHFAALALDRDGSPRISYGGNGDLKFAWIGTRPALTPSPTPTPTATPARPSYVSNRSLMVPGTVEAEDYDGGGEGITYHDSTVANEGGAYRIDAVDIK